MTNLLPALVVFIVPLVAAYIWHRITARGPVTYASLVGRAAVIQGALSARLAYTGATILIEPAPELGGVDCYRMFIFFASGIGECCHGSIEELSRIVASKRIAWETRRRAEASPA